MAIKFNLTETLIALVSNTQHSGLVQGILGFKDNINQEQIDLLTSEMQDNFDTKAKILSMELEHLSEGEIQTTLNNDIELVNRLFDIICKNYKEILISFMQ
jgi:hypothetical protein